MMDNSYLKQSRTVPLAPLAAHWLRCCTLVAAIAVTGCNREDAPASALMKSDQVISLTPEQVISKYRNAPVGQSIGPLVNSLLGRSVLVGIENTGETQPTTLPLKVAADNQGRWWAYAYTNKSEFSKAFPQGGPFTEMNFSDVFKIIESDQRFGGIFLNSSSDAMYPIPRELFEKVKKTLAGVGR